MVGSTYKAAPKAAVRCSCVTIVVDCKQFFNFGRFYANTCYLEHTAPRAGVVSTSMRSPLT